LGTAGTNPATNFIGTTDSQPFEVRTQNARSLRIEPSAILFGGVPITTNTIAGSSANAVAAGVRGATIAGGGAPTGNSDPNFPEEAPNTVTDSYGTVGGGYSNRAGDNAGLSTDNAFATVGGGINNIASAASSTVGGGFSNSASEDHSTVSGGRSNTASGYVSTVGGGINNIASAASSTVGGGQRNAASGIRSTVGGGDFNTASGDHSTVGGGDANCAGGDFSWAGGRRAKVRPGVDPADPIVASPCTGLTYPGGSGDEGTFVWADSQGTNFVSTGKDQFLIRAQGGMAINTKTPAANAALTVNGNVAVASTGTMSFGAQGRQMLNLFNTDYGIGVQTSRMYFRTNNGFSWFEDGVHSETTDSPGAGGTMHMRLSTDGQLQTTTGTISSLSDARLKDQVQDYTQALDQINALRPVRYHYRDAGKAAFQPEGLHLGFVAQEMQQVFPEWVSEGEDGYLMLSMRGFEAVAVRAMQELSAENAGLKDDVSALQAQLAAQAARFDALEARINQR